MYEEKGNADGSYFVQIVVDSVFVFSPSLMLPSATVLAIMAANTHNRIRNAIFCLNFH